MFLPVPIRPYSYQTLGQLVDLRQVRGRHAQSELVGQLRGFFRELHPVAHGHASQELGVEHRHLRVDTRRVAVHLWK